jgi:PCI domain
VKLSCVGHDDYSKYMKLQLMNDISYYLQAKQLIASRRMHSIRNLTFTYMTLPLQNIVVSAALEDVKEAEKFLFNMVASGEIKASVDQKTGMVRFSNTGETSTCSDAKARENGVALLGLEGNIRATLEVSERLRAIQQRVLTSEEFLLKPTGRGFHSGGVGHADSVGWGDSDSLYLNM